MNNDYDSYGDGRLTAACRLSTPLNALPLVISAFRSVQPADMQITLKRAEIAETRNYCVFTRDQQVQQRRE